MKREGKFKRKSFGFGSENRTSENHTSENHTNEIHMSQGPKDSLHDFVKQTLTSPAELCVWGPLKTFSTYLDE